MVNGLKIFAGLLALALCVVGGCNIIAPIAIAVTPPESRDAEYILPDVTTVVFVDDRRNILNNRRLRPLIGDSVSSNLMANKALSDTVQSAAAQRASEDETAGQLKSLEQIGLDVGAKQVISVEMQSFIAAVEGGAPRAAATCAIKVIDCENKVRLFPAEDESGRVVVIDLPMDSLVQASSQVTREDMERQLAAAIAERVAKLFYKHLVRTQGPTRPEPSRIE